MVCATAFYDISRPLFTWYGSPQKCRIPDLIHDLSIKTYQKVDILSLLLYCPHLLSCKSMAGGLLPKVAKQLRTWSEKEPLKPLCWLKLKQGLQLRTLLLKPLKKCLYLPVFGISGTIVYSGKWRRGADFRPQNLCYRSAYRGFQSN
jgi:hypothetical protein